MTTNPKILIACEESQVVTQAFRDLGYEAWSCDILPTSGSHPEWHLQQDVLELISSPWDLVIAFPPCTHLASSGAKHFKQKQADGRQKAAIDFFLAMLSFNSPRIAVENPVGIMSTEYRKPDQIVQPYQYGDGYKKTTCLWLKGLPKLKPLSGLQVWYSGQKEFKSGKKMSDWYYKTSCLPHAERSKARSKFPAGIATAMAEQWSKVL
jgi:hypothetical protein